MLTDRQRARCREIAQSLDAGEMTLWRKAEPTLTPAERAEVWEQRAAQQQREAAVMPRHDSASNDLDYWPPEVEGKPAPMPPKRMPMPRTDDDEDSPPVLPDDDDNDVAPEQEEKTCPTCNGRGRTHDGLTCPTCGGTGRVRDDEEDNDEDKE
jgi:hypothetical protein